MDRVIVCERIRYAFRGRPKKQLGSEDRIRRDVANGNERRRMECINNLINSLKDKLKFNRKIKIMTKASVLFECVNYIKWLDREIKAIEFQNNCLKEFLENNQRQYEELKEISNQQIKSQNICDLQFDLEEKYSTLLNIPEENTTDETPMDLRKYYREHL